MPGFELGHLLVILFVAFLVLGPERMVQMARSLGQFSQQAQREWVQFSRSFQDGLQGANQSSVESTAAPATAETPPVSESAPSSSNVETQTSPSIPESAQQSLPATAIVPSPTGTKQAKPPPQTIPEHLLELRSRLIASLLAIIILTSIAYIFSDTILYILRLPAGDIKLRSFSPMDGFLVHFRVALYGGIFLSAPVWIYEAMRFFLPGLYAEEKRLIVPGVLATVLLFLLGNLFGYLMLKNMMSVIFTMFGSELEYFPSADPYISFVVFFLIATGISFELPIVLLIVIRLGWLSPNTLRTQRKISYFIIFVFAELITPVADPIVAPTIVMLPMIVLFELALFLARFVAPKPAAIAATSNSPTAP